MRLSSLFIVIGTFVAAAVLCVIAALFAAQLVEESSRVGVRNELDREALTWADVDTEGLQVFLIGTAPNEAARFQALSAAGRVVDAARVIDQMNVFDDSNLAPPRFSLEALRNEAGISLIGLVPAATDRAELVARIKRAVPDTPVADLMETSDHPAPEGWVDALNYSINALRDLPSSKISVEAGSVRVIGTVESASARRSIETDLARRAGDDIRLALDIKAPRQVISPFTVRFIRDESGVRFDACSADTEDARVTILAAATAAGLNEKPNCTIGLGVPTRRWAEAVEMGIKGIDEIGGGTVTFADTEVSLIVPEGTDRALFDKVVGELENGLPDVFVLTAIRPEPQDEEDEGPPEFVATLSPEGQVQLRGRINSEVVRQSADSFARAAFGSDAVRTVARVDEDLPASWSARVLAALSALSKLSNGAVVVTPDAFSVAGNTGNQNAQAEIAGLLAGKLGEAQDFDIRVTYQEKLDPLLSIPTPEECEATVTEIMGNRKISFEPGSANIDPSANDLLDEIAELLKLCGEIPLEIGGHTDSQGREIMNQQLSQQRAQAVVDELRTRRVLTASYTVKGYGETQPIADNKTEEGREANRRIEFRLIRPDPAEDTPTTLENNEAPLAATATQEDESTE